MAMRLDKAGIGTLASTVNDFCLNGDTGSDINDLAVVNQNISSEGVRGNRVINSEILQKKHKRTSCVFSHCIVNGSICQAT